MAQCWGILTSFKGFPGQRLRNYEVSIIPVFRKELKSLETENFKKMQRKFFFYNLNSKTRNIQNSRTLTNFRRKTLLYGNHFRFPVENMPEHEPNRVFLQEVIKNRNYCRNWELFPYFSSTGIVVDNRVEHLQIYARNRKSFLEIEIGKRLFER